MALLGLVLMQSCKDNAILLNDEIEQQEIIENGQKKIKAIKNSNLKGIA